MFTHWPIYFKDRLYIGNLEAPVAICTLWTPKERIAQGLKKDSFCVAGQLYSGRGLNFIVRNLLAKPSIQYLVVCGKSLTDSDQLILDFFESGKGRDDYIDEEIPSSTLGNLRDYIKVIDLVGDTNPDVVRDVISGCDSKDYIREPQTFPEPKYSQSGNFPTDSSVFEIRGNYIGEVWLFALKHILKFGIPGERIGGYAVQSIHNLAAVIQKEDSRSPKVYPFFNFELADIENYIKNFFNPVLGEHSYSYGGRLQKYKGVNQIKVMK
ncbi:MAG: hypothetical protein U9M98_01400, partial [Patescibacteria group bacterium]|nr:hypothetical protein [Patescibacteria group bacterium]